MVAVRISDPVPWTGFSHLRETVREISTARFLASCRRGARDGPGIYAKPRKL